MPSQQNNASIKFLIAKWCLVSAFLFSLVFLPFSVFGNSYLITDDFEAYDLGDLYTQGQWIAPPPSSTNFDVVNTKPHTGDKSVNCLNCSDIHSAYYTAVEKQTTGEIYFYAFLPSTGGTGAYSPVSMLIGCKELSPTSCYNLGGIQVNKVDGVYGFGSRTNGDYGELESDLETDVWHLIGLSFDEPNWQFKIKIDSGNWSEWLTMDREDLISEIDAVYKLSVIYYTPSSAEIYVDDFSGFIPEPELRVWGISPDSGTEITDLDTEFQFGWEDLDEFDGLLISFYNKKTRIHTNAKRYDTDVIGFDGTKILNLQDFLFEKNADWYFNAIAFWEQPETYEGLYLTGRYITEYTQNIVSPEYFLTINIEGFPTIFEMEDWETWYGEHAEQFETPTLLFGRVATLFAPTFENIGEFGQRILDYFEVDKAYSRGYELGLAIPIFGYYLTSVEVFYGGLPVMKLFLMTLILMVGIFLFKIVMKFIPFFG